MSVRPPHFKNKTHCVVTKGLQASHQFTLPYAPWRNGVVTSLGKEWLPEFHALSSELGVHPGEWPYLLSLVRNAFNNLPLQQCTSIPPIKTLTGMDSSPPIAFFYASFTSASVSFPDIVHDRTPNIKGLWELVDALHPVVQDALQGNCRHMRDQTSKGKLPNFTEGESVLVAREKLTAGESSFFVGTAPADLLRWYTIMVIKSRI